MCGLFGIIQTPTAIKKREVLSSHIAKFADMYFKTGTLRGTDGSGYFYDDGGKALYCKEAVPGHDFKHGLNSEHGMRSLVGHVRASTSGANSDKNCHPFVESNTILVHNGTLLNEFTFNAPVDYEVDSHEMTYLINKVGIKEALEDRVRGAYAIAMLNTLTWEYHLVRNEARPMSYCLNEAGTAIAFGSEAGHLEWLLNRDAAGVPTAFKKQEVLDLPVGTMITIGDTIQFEEIKLLDRAGYSYHTGYSYYGYGGTTSYVKKYQPMGNVEKVGTRVVGDYFPLRDGDGVYCRMGWSNSKKTWDKTRAVRFLLADPWNSAMVEYYPIKGTELHDFMVDMDSVSSPAEYEGFTQMYMAKLNLVDDEDKGSQDPEDYYLTGLTPVQDPVSGLNYLSGFKLKDVWREEDILRTTKHMCQMINANIPNENLYDDTYDIPFSDVIPDITNEIKVMGPDGFDIPLTEAQAEASLGCGVCGSPIAEEDVLTEQYDWWSGAMCHSSCFSMYSHMTDQ